MLKTSADTVPERPGTVVAFMGAMSNAYADAPFPHLVDSTMLWGAPGGAVRRYLLAKRHWLERETDWRHTIVAPSADAEVVDCGGIAIPGLRGMQWPLRRRAAASVIEREAPDLVEVGDPFGLAWAALDAAQRLGVPSLAFCHGSPARLVQRLGGGGRRSWAQRAVRAYLRRLYTQFDLVLAPCDAMLRELRDLGLTRVQRQPLGLDCALFHPGRRDAVGWRAELGIGADTRVLLYVGRFDPERNLALLADAVRKLGPGHLLVAAGEGIAPPRGRQVRVLPRFAGAAQRARALASADAFVDAGVSDSAAACGLEAMACGTPLVVRGSGVSTEICEGGAGFALRSQRPVDWAEAITALFAADRETWSSNARERALDSDWGSVMPALLARYQRLLDGSAATQPSPATMRNRLAFGEVTQPAVHAARRDVVL
jgi:alpha-1,6-mannosyltransferase